MGSTDIVDVDQGGEGSIVVEGREYLRQKVAAGRLKVGPRTIQRLGAQKFIRTCAVPGLRRGRYYLADDVESVRKYGVTIGNIALHPDDGALSLSRPMGPLPAQPLVKRLDYSFELLARYGLLKGETLELVRSNIAYAVIHSRRRDRHDYAVFAKPEANREQSDPPPDESKKKV